jgi:NAD-dependent SIR2 family protein deacetylase
MQTISCDSDEMQRFAASLARCKKSAWIIGAGCSTAAEIPDFRSAESGLFARLKAQNPELKINSGKELFHANLFQVRLAGCGRRMGWYGTGY